MKKLTYFLLFTLLSCTQKRTYTEPEYRLMISDFATQLESNYNRWDTIPSYDKNGKRIIKSIFKNSKAKSTYIHQYYQHDHKNMGYERYKNGH